MHADYLLEKFDAIPFSVGFDNVTDSSGLNASHHDYDYYRDERI